MIHNLGVGESHVRKTWSQHEAKKMGNDFWAICFQNRENPLVDTEAQGAQCWTTEWKWEPSTHSIPKGKSLQSLNHINAACEHCIFKISLEPKWKVHCDSGTKQRLWVGTIAAGRAEVGMGRGGQGVEGQGKISEHSPILHDSGSRGNTWSWGGQRLSVLFKVPEVGVPGGSVS